MPQSQSYRTELAEKRRLESIARYTTDMEKLSNSRKMANTDSHREV